MSQKLADSLAFAITVCLCITAPILTLVIKAVNYTSSPENLYFSTYDNVQYCRTDLAQQGKDLRTIDIACGKYPNVSDFIKTKPIPKND
jgi:hypothetical protein